MRKHLMTAVVLVALVLLPAVAAQVSVEFDESTDFDRFATYTMREGKPAQRLEVQLTIEDFVKRELSQRGLLPVEDAPDLIVRTYTLVGKLTLKELSDETTWEFYTGLTDMDAYSVNGGTLVVDILDGEAEKILWRGLITAPVNSSVASVERKLDKAVAKMFQRFPR